MTETSNVAAHGVNTVTVVIVDCTIRIGDSDAEDAWLH